MVPSRYADVRGVEEHVIGERERVTPEGEQDVVMPLGAVSGGEVCNTPCL
jgi:hypothetical protein